MYRVIEVWMYIASSVQEVWGVLRGGVESEIWLYIIEVGRYIGVLMEWRYRHA